MAIVYTSELFGTGGNVIVSVATFADLPVAGADEQRISITGESLLFNTTNYPAIVSWSGSFWQLESAAATYLNIAAVEFASGTWTGTGGITLGTKSGALLRDTTYNEVWIWNSTNNIFVPRYLGLTTIGNQQKIKGDSLTLESGWSTTVGTNSSLVTSGGKLVMTSTSTSSPVTSSVVKIFYTDTAGTGNTNNFYMKGLFQRTNCVVASTGGAEFYIRHDTGSAGNMVEFGDGTTSNTSIQVAGKFKNRLENVNVIYPGYPNRGDTGWTSETLVQFRLKAYDQNIKSVGQVKIGTGGWHDILVYNCRSGAGSLRFEMGTASNNGVANIGAGTVRYLQAIRYT